MPDNIADFQQFLISEGYEPPTEATAVSSEVAPVAEAVAPVASPQAEEKQFDFSFESIGDAFIEPEAPVEPEAEQPKPEKTPEQMKQDFTDIKSGIEPTIAEREIPFISAGARAYEGAKERLGEDITRVEEEAGEAPGIMGGLEGAAKLAVPILGEATGVVGETLLMGAIDTVKAFIPDAQEEKIAEGFQKVLETEGGQTALEFLGKGVEAWEGFAEENPNIAANVEGALKLAEIIPGVKAVKSGVKLTRKGIRAGRKVGGEISDFKKNVKGIFDEIDSGKIKPKQAIEKTKDLPTPEKSSLADSVSSSMNKITPSKQQQFQSMTGKETGQWLNERGITGTRNENVPALVKYWQNSKAKVDEALDIPRDVFQSQEYREAIDVLEGELGKRAKDRPRLNALRKKHESRGLTLAEENEVKRMFQKNVATAHKADVTKTAKQKRDMTDLDDALREGLISRAEKLEIKGIRDLNRETQAARFLADEIAGKQAGQAANNLMSLTDTILISGTAINPAFLAQYGLKKTLGSERAKSLLIKSLNWKGTKQIDTPDLETIRKAEAGRFLEKELAPLKVPALPSGEGVVPSAKTVNVKPIKLRESPVKANIKEGGLTKKELEIKEGISKTGQLSIEAPRPIIPQVRKKIKVN